MPSFNKLYYMTLTGEKKLNAVQVYINKEILAQSGIDINAILNIRAESGRIIIEEEKK